MRYTLDLSRIPLADYQTLLANQNLLPGRRLLHDGIDRHFQALSAEQIETLAQLKQRLSAPQKLAALAAATGISEEYLVLLKREIGSLEQKPIPLSAFPGLAKHFSTRCARRVSPRRRTGLSAGKQTASCFASATSRGSTALAALRRGHSTKRGSLRGRRCRGRRKRDARPRQRGQCRAWLL